MSTMKTYTQDDADAIAGLLVGRRIVQAEMGTFDYPDRGWREEPEGRLVLDDGTVLYLAGNDGGCACTAGCYPLAKVAAVDNIMERLLIGELLPIVSAWAEQHAARRAAEVLGAAAAEQRHEAEQVPWDDEGTHADGHRCAAAFLDRRAAALTPATEEKR